MPGPVAGNPDASPGTCDSCATRLEGEYCHVCGQHALERPDSLRAFLALSLGDVFSFRSKTLRSLTHLVFKPGQATAAWFSGMRVEYTQPTQLYLIAAAVFFMANSVRPFVAITEDNRVNSALGGLWIGQKISLDRLTALTSAGIPIDVFRERFQSAVSQSLPPFMVGSILVFALALALFSPRRKALLHVMFSLHWTGFYLFLMSLERLTPGQPGTSSAIGQILVLAAAFHLVLALRRAYGHSWHRAVLNGFGLTVCFNMILAGWVTAVVWYAFQTAV